MDLDIEIYIYTYKLYAGTGISHVKHFFLLVAILLYFLLFIYIRARRARILLARCDVVVDETESIRITYARVYVYDGRCTPMTVAEGTLNGKDKATCEPPQSPPNNRVYAIFVISFCFCFKIILHTRVRTRVIYIFIAFSIRRNAPPIVRTLW